MRVGGAYPFGQGAVPIPLRTGQQFYMPPGNYLVTLGSQTVMQYFDPSQATWRCVGMPDNIVNLQDSDGFNYRLVNASGVAVGGSITNAGSGAVNGIGAAATGVALSFGAAPSNGVAAAAYPIVGGSINTTITITNGGSGFVVPPLLLLDPPPLGGIQATAVCTISGGVINAVTVTNAGAGYTSAPNCYVIPQFATYQGLGVPVNATAPTNTIPPGLVAPVVGINSYPTFLPFIQYTPAASGGALLTVNPVLTGSGTLTGFVMTNYGANYVGTAIPTIAITGAGAAAATAIMSFSLVSITITSGGAAYQGTQVLISSYGLIKATDGNNGVYQPRSARGTATQGGGVINATVIEDAGFGMQSVPVIGVIQTNGTPATTVATLTAVVGGVSDVTLLQPATQ
jgi:hypothetical protein